MKKKCYKLVIKLEDAVEKDYLIDITMYGKILDRPKCKLQLA